MTSEATREVQIPPSGDPFTASFAPTTNDYAAARRIVFRERTGPPMDPDPMEWLGFSDGDDDERRPE